MRPVIDAFSLLTTIPLSFGSEFRQPSKYAPVFFPVAGLVIGLGSAGLMIVLQEFLPDDLAAILTLGGYVMLSGALHFDGLADYADGIFGGTDPDDRMRIMKQPDIGVFGVVAIVLVVGIDWSSLRSVPNSQLWIVLGFGGMISRSAPAIVMLFTDYVSQAGIGSGYSNLKNRYLTASILVSVLFAFVLGGTAGLAVAGIAIATAVAVGVLARRRLGGANGDVYGAAIEMSFATSLVSAVAIVTSSNRFEPLWVNL